MVMWLIRINYYVTITVNPGILLVEIEQTETTERWSAEFSSNCKYHELDFRNHSLSLILIVLIKILRCRGYNSKSWKL